MTRQQPFDPAFLSRLYDKTIIEKTEYRIAIMNAEIADKSFRNYRPLQPFGNVVRLLNRRRGNELVEWCEEFTNGLWSYRFEMNYQHGLIGASVIAFHFEHETDAVYFKLRWYEDK